MAETMTSEITLTKYTLTAPGDMFEALAELSAAVALTGGLTVGPGTDATAEVWRLEMYLPDEDQPGGNRMLPAQIGDVVVRIGSAVEVMSSAKFNDKYGS